MHFKILWCSCFRDAGIYNREHFVEFDERIFQQTIAIPTGTNLGQLLAGLFLYPYVTDLIQDLMRAGKECLAQQFNFTYRYIDNVLSLNNSKFSEYLEFIYPRELEIKETSETTTSSSYFDLYLYIDKGNLTTMLYDSYFSVFEQQYFFFFCTSIRCLRLTVYPL